MSSAVGTAEGAHEFASQIPVHVSRLADRGTLASLPGAAHRLGHAGYLLFESAVFSIAYFSKSVGMMMSATAVLAIIQSFVLYPVTPPP